MSEPLESVARRASLMRRYELEVERKVERIIDRAYQRVEALIYRQDPTAVSQGWQARRMASLTDRADGIFREAFREINATVAHELTGLAGVAAKIAAREIIAEAAVRLPSKALLAAIITTDPVQGATLRNWWGQQTVRAQNAFRRELQIGMTRRESVREIVTRLRGRVIKIPGGTRLEGGAMKVTLNEAKVIARTAVNEVQNRAHLITLRQNADLVWGFEWVATLDERTCVACGDLDGKRWALEDPKRVEPPIHPNDRCTVISVRRPNQKQRRKTYTEWFSEQTPETQASIVGRGTYELLAMGKVNFTDLVRSDNRPITLAALKSKLGIVD